MSNSEKITPERCSEAGDVVAISKGKPRQAVLFRSREPFGLRNLGGRSWRGSLRVNWYPCRRYHPMRSPISPTGITIQLSHACCAPYSLPRFGRVTSRELHNALHRACAPILFHHMIAIMLPKREARRFTMPYGFYTSLCLQLGLRNHRSSLLSPPRGPQERFQPPLSPGGLRDFFCQIYSRECRNTASG